MIIWDTETTGTNETDAILSIAVMDSRTGQVLLDTLVRPPKHLMVWPRVEAMHGITPEMVQDAPTMAEVWPRVRGLLAGGSAAYGAALDLRLLAQSLGGGWQAEEGTGESALLWHEDHEDQAVLRVQCAMLRYARHVGEPSRRDGFKWHKLEDAAQAAGHDLQYAHTALADAQATAAVWRYLDDQGVPVLS
jgi:DNA polymerase-3 subunit epsilon